ncbi:hypothetical protein M422DRAFT_54048 [Sphaerobolus stellatus SS14]|uniref:Chromo domain-containing protein n=1 Tax=Sphaerobolus stellatus (strain SS14) TaxID=990650 RepID=A0A0C9TJ93_SPHS4|nr:hypothetical protein M422DRAFT_54048 [Sphaerobolus stellatus SS14]
MPASYRIHPVLNIAHLEPYEKSPQEFGERPVKELNRADFDQLQEWSVEKIIRSKCIKAANGRKVERFLTRFEGYDSSWDEWLSQTQLKNAPSVLREWERSQRIHHRK